jgi:hypothetical protein
MSEIKTYQLESVEKCKADNSYHGFRVESTTITKDFKSTMIVADECSVTGEMLWLVFEDALGKNLQNVFLGDPDDEEPKYSVDYDGEFAFLFVNSFDSKNYFPKFRIKIVEPKYVRFGDMFSDMLNKIGA